MAYDLLVKGGTVVDPSQKLHQVCDVAFSGGKVAAVGEGIPESQARDVIDVSGLIVTPGLIDLHTHVYWGVSTYGIDADDTCLARGVTTVVDAGSAGAATFAGFRRYVLERKKTRILAFLHISAMGLLSREIQELEDMRWADVAAAVEVAREHSDVVLGIKVRLSNYIVAGKDIEALTRSLEAAGQLGEPVMVHIGRTPSPLPRILEMMRPGDIITHSFTGHAPNILDEDGNVLPAVRRARERGVVFDQGHGAGSHSFDVAQKALAQGFGPSTISSDLHIYSLEHPVHDLATCISKYMHFGVSVDEAVRLSTEAPAEIIGMSGRVGTLKAGAEGDLAAFRMEEGSFAFTDSYENSVEGTRRLVPVITVKGGEVYRVAGG